MDEYIKELLKLNNPPKQAFLVYLAEKLLQEGIIENANQYFKVLNLLHG